MVEKFGINVRYNPANPMNDLNCFLVVGLAASLTVCILSSLGLIDYRLSHNTVAKAFNTAIHNYIF